MGHVFRLVGAETMRGLDRFAIEALDLSGELLMENAGRAVTRAVLAVRPPDGSVAVVCGTGNNGGDGFVVARQLAGLGVPVEVVLVGDSEALRGDAAANHQRARRAGIAEAPLAASLPPADVVVDALFGTGLSREVVGESARAVGAINAAGEYAVVVAVDLPSGVDADTGQTLGVAVEADLTVTLAVPKLGLALEPGRSLAGDVVVARIGIPNEAPGLAPDAELWTAAAAGLCLPERPEAGHKGRFGHVLVVAGSEGKTGAAALAAEAAGRAGAGLVTVACPAGLGDILEVKCTEAMTVPVLDTPQRCFAAGASTQIVALAAERDVVALGPGIGTNEETVKCVQAVVEAIEQPLVLDADALNCLAGQGELLRGRRGPTLLTPHPGEAGRWLGLTPAEINADRVGAARRLAELTGSVVLLKGAASVIAAPGGAVAINPTGGPVLGSGGTGDVLTGLCAGLLAQGLLVDEAAALGAFVHGAAGDRLAAARGEAGVLAGELAAEIPATVEALRARAIEGLEEADPGEELEVAFPEP
ncbi:MAG: NAD(P)H-hydrate dehydratase [Deltaproteobacteria bacterium]|nr:NAD(P)H-hydrate dehydratase [Deltaproteobacteria bacterium]MBW2447113.1 NAD(P)H-hydrate dehydratase [Deltaproteobacteria bacterium]